jgi:small nuclear ribonucleoprotein (snRNP)-like protein
MKKEVIQRILKVIKDKRLRDQMIRKVQNNEDLSLRESYLLYKDVEFGEELQMINKRTVDIDWTDHAEYRGELRGINPHGMNEKIKDTAKERFLKNPKDKRKNQRFKTPEGTAVVDYSVDKNPADVDVITTWASEEEALQYLADLTGKRIIIAGNSLSIYSDKTKLKEAFDQLEGEGFFDQSMGKSNPESLGWVFSNFDRFEEAVKDAKEWDDDPDDIDITSVYGKGGGNRYRIMASGLIKFSEMHSTKEKAEEARSVGFEVS